MICDIFARGPGHDDSSVAVVGKTLYFSDDETDCLPKPPDPKLVRERRHPDRSGRRRSANADILESVGLPSTVSYHDMKTLQDGLSVDDILGRRSTCSGRFKEAASIVGGNVAKVARRASKSVATVARWTKQMTPPAVNKKLQKKSYGQDKRYSPFDGDLQPDNEKSQEVNALPHVLDWKSGSLPQLEDNMQAMQPGQWLR